VPVPVCSPQAAQDRIRDLEQQLQRQQVVLYVCLCLCVYGCACVVCVCLCACVCVCVCSFCVYVCVRVCVYVRVCLALTLTDACTQETIDDLAAALDTKDQRIDQLTADQVKRVFSFLPLCGPSFSLSSSLSLSLSCH
jgi:hypothetical protein